MATRVAGVVVVMFIVVPTPSGIVDNAIDDVFRAPPGVHQISNLAGRRRRLAEARIARLSDGPWRLSSRSGLIWGCGHPVSAIVVDANGVSVCGECR